MAVDAYLNFKGNCREAVEFYAEAFGTEQPKFMTFGEIPASPEHPVPDEAKNWIMHTRLKISGSNVMFSDVFPGMPFTEGNNISLALVTDSKEELVSAYEKLKEGGTVIMELQETFWAPYYGSVRDKFGIEWQFNLGMSEM
ncbi:PhnB protein [Paenibacillus phyllosphaerae]|uniref:PhnB protein n=1 Tax=Paenibacillus phyllosphaerae TaxID=274593 RepID=A0A7W5AXH0_9BACL|nr:VOC family protein [Paenibacillus phyllosphaerae]MBB3110402.1 PhnB protein [Paenibacillus phyllosphaerae]